MSSVFTLDNIGVDCSQDVSNTLNTVFHELLAKDDIPKDTLISMLHSKDSLCNDHDIRSIMTFLDSSEKKFNSKIENAEEVEKFLNEGLERSYTIDSKNVLLRSLEIPKNYRDQKTNKPLIPLPPIASSYTIDEATIIKNHLISPAAIFDHVPALDQAKMVRKSLQNVPSTLMKGTTSQLLKASETKINYQVKELKRKPTLGYHVTNNVGKAGDSNKTV